MLSSLQFTKNLAAIGFLLVLVMGTAMTTLLLSPISPGDLTSGNTAGAFTDQSAEIISHFLPLEIVDIAENDLMYTTQLVRVGERSFNYFVKIGARSQGQFDYRSLEIRNRNNADVDVTVSVSIPAQSASSVSIFVDDYYNRMSLHAAYPELTRNRVLTIPAKSARKIALGFDYSQDLSYPLELSLQIVF